MERIPYKIVFDKNVDGSDTRFYTMTGPLVNILLVKWIGVIIRGSYQEAAE